jgi:hypothetical protein
MIFEPICQDLFISSRTSIGKGEGVLYNPKYGNHLIYLEHQMLTLFVLLIEEF